jgi:hypothetical protein
MGCIRKYERKTNGWYDRQSAETKWFLVIELLANAGAAMEEGVVLGIYQGRGPLE